MRWTAMRWTGARFWISASLALILSGSLAQLSAQDALGVLVISGGTLIDGLGGAPLENSLVQRGSYWYNYTYPTYTAAGPFDSSEENPTCKEPVGRAAFCFPCPFLLC